MIVVVCEQTMCGVLARHSAYVPVTPTWSKQRFRVAEPEAAVILEVELAVVK